MPQIPLEPGEPFLAADIAAIEHAVGRSMPAAYRRFAETFGGAFVGGEVDGSPDLSLLEFLSAKRVIRALDSHSDLRDDGIIPIARCELGNLYVLDRAGAVHHLNYYGGQTKASFVAHSFDELLSRITVSDQ
jgi:hypothetical protein